MATFADLKFTHRVFTKNYPFSRYAVEDNPCAKLEKPLNECKFALITSAGFMRPDDERFSNLIKMGDTSFREIPNDFPVQELIEDHNSDSFDHEGIEADKNLAFPLDRFKELEKDDKIGSLNHRHFSFMGSIISPGSLIKKTAPEIANLLKEDRVDAVFLAPV
jgi:D-proline reductase (dithiol) PrdB